MVLLFGECGLLPVKINAGTVFRVNEQVDFIGKCQKSSLDIFPDLRTVWVVLEIISEQAETIVELVENIRRNR